MVSAVIPTFNYGRFVVEAVESALQQTFSNIEVIVVDDGSTDDTAERLKPYGNLIRHIHQHNQGLSAARNTGIRAARGQWIALLDADDTWHPQKTEVQLRAVSGIENCALIGAKACGRMQETLLDKPEIQLLTIEDFLLSNAFGPSSALIRRQAFERIGYFDTNLHSVEDRDMWLRLAVAFPAVRIDSRCWSYRRHPEQMNRNAARMYENYRRVLDKFFNQHPEHAALRPSAYAFMYMDAAWSHFEEGRQLKAMGYVLRSVFQQPRAMRNGSAPWFRGKSMVRFALGDRLFDTLQNLCFSKARGGEADRELSVVGGGVATAAKRN